MKGLHLIADDLVGLVPRPGHGPGCFVTPWQSDAEDDVIAGAEKRLADEARLDEIDRRS